MRVAAVKTRTGGLIHFIAVFFSLLSLTVAQNRIIGGDETTIKDYPYQLSLEGGKRHICGGSILTRDWALTAAHCVNNEPEKWMSFRAGSTKRGEGGTVHPVKHYITHEKYSGRKTLDYDIAVVSVKVPFNFKTGIMPVILPITVPRADEYLRVAGWGYMEQQRLRKPKNLMATTLKVIDWYECKKLYSAVTARMMCAGEYKKDICVGDSGGALVRGAREQVGIVSWGYKCGSGYPSFYTDISTLLPWIREKTGLESVDEDARVFPEDTITFPEDAIVFPTDTDTDSWEERIRQYFKPKFC
uniref:Peptidase S1 domain-containing protein n=1 Tax=Graphocephala atropunctata TaxID=36148 RepID=A0A1B6MQ38_9HEMI